MPEHPNYHRIACGVRRQSVLESRVVVRAQDSLALIQGIIGDDWKPHLKIFYVIADIPLVDHMRKCHLAPLSPFVFSLGQE